MKEDSLPPQPHPGMPPHLQHHNSFQHIRPPQASASPPMPNGLFQPRHPTPQPGMDSRPGSRNTIRRTSSNLVPIQHHPGPNPPQNGFAYVPNPPIYNPQAAQTMPPHPSPQPQFRSPQPQFRSPQPQYQQFPPQQHPTPHPQMQHPQYMNQPQAPIPRPASQPQIQRHDSLQPPHHPPPRASPQPPQSDFKPPQQTPPQPRHLSSKSHSIFTPIDEGGSVLAQHFFGAPDPSRVQIKKESSPDLRAPPRSVTAQVKTAQSMSQPPRPQSSSNEFAPPQRTNTSGSKSGARPKLNLQIPSEASDGESAAGSAQPSGGASANPARNNDHIVLPPPSPSASALLSAGATGPPNPFARPPPPTSQNRDAYNENRNNIETPISALPSRYMSNELLPSPSNFFSEWGDFGRNGGLNSAVLPSPLTFPNPAEARGASFASREGEGSGDKRKNSVEADSQESKRIKT